MSVFTETNRDAFDRINALVKPSCAVLPLKDVCEILDEVRSQAANDLITRIRAVLDEAQGGAA
jgi:hypothetical protein